MSISASSSDKFSSPHNINQKLIFIYGPPGSGKSSIGRMLANDINTQFIDLDETIEANTGKTISKIFEEEGENNFRIYESGCLQEAISINRGVIALGGGALLDADNRAKVENAGIVLCVNAAYDDILLRLENEPNKRPLVSEEIPTKLKDLLESRAGHYASFTYKLENVDKSIEELVWEAQIILGIFHVNGMGSGYDVLVAPGSLEKIGTELKNRELRGPIALVSDKNVADLYAESVIRALQKSGYMVEKLIFPAGESNKTLATVQKLWKSFLDMELERTSTVIALGGGVVGDVAGFAASAYMRGVKWVAVPTSLLAMCDASLGGKTGVDLPEGKNLVGAFHPPSLVLVDPDTLFTLPKIELLSGLAEVIKHGIIADPELFRMCTESEDLNDLAWFEIVCRGMAVKINIIQSDPFEQGLRSVLNLGHTLGHAVEQVSEYKLKHGEAVSIGIVAASRLSEYLGIAEMGLTNQIKMALNKVRLPTEIPEDLNIQQVITSMRFDKKRKGGELRFVLPVRIGNVNWGIVVDDISPIIPA